jgi:large subunit ribosomal protein L25
MSDVLNLAAEARDRVGKGAARSLRRAGRIPAIIYGDKKDPLAISIGGFELGNELKTRGFYRRLYDISVDGEKHRVLPRDLQRDPVTDRPLHVDFLRISAGARINVAVVVIFANEEESPGLKRGGVLNIVRHDIELSCPAASIPEALHVDLTGLEIGDSVHISQIALPDDVEPVISDRDFTIATIAAPTVVVEEDKAEEGEEGIEGVEGEEGEVAEAADGETVSGETTPKPEKE